MRPGKPATTDQKDLFRARLDQIINMRHELVLLAGRYAHAKQFKRARREPKFLRTRLGRLIRDIRRKTEGDGSMGMGSQDLEL